MARTLYTSKMSKENSAQFFSFQELKQQGCFFSCLELFHVELETKRQYPTLYTFTIFWPVCSETLSLLLLLWLFSLFLLVFLYYSLYIVIFLLILSLIYSFTLFPLLSLLLFPLLFFYNYSYYSLQFLFVFIGALNQTRATRCQLRARSVLILYIIIIYYIYIIIFKESNKKRSKIKKQDIIINTKSQIFGNAFVLQ